MLRGDGLQGESVRREQEMFSKRPGGMQPFIKMKGPGGVHDIGAPNPSLCAQASEGTRSREVESVNQCPLRQWEKCTMLTLLCN